MHRAGGRIRPHQKVLLECIPLKRKHIAHDFDLLAIVFFDLTGENRCNNISIDVSSTQEVARRIYFSKKSYFYLHTARSRSIYFAGWVPRLRAE